MQLTLEVRDLLDMLAQHGYSLYTEIDEAAMSVLSGFALTRTAARVVEHLRFPTTIQGLLAMARFSAIYHG